MWPLRAESVPDAPAVDLQERIDVRDTTVERPVLDLQDGSAGGVPRPRSRRRGDRLRTAVEAAPLGFAMTDAHGRVEVMNRAMAFLLGVDARAVAGRHLSAILPGECPAPRHPLAYHDDTGPGEDIGFRRDGAPGGPHTHHLRVGGVERWVDHTVVEVAGGVGSPPLSVHGLIDRTSAQRHLSILSHDDSRDPLTGLANLPGLMRWLGHERALAASPAGAGHPSYYGLILCDIDSFGALNLRLGARAADELLAVVGHRIRSLVRSRDFVARSGADEFAVVLRGAGLWEARSVGDKILAAHAEPLTLGSSRGHRVEVTLSLSASRESMLADPETALQRARRDLRAARRSGPGDGAHGL